MKKKQTIFKQKLNALTIFTCIFTIVICLFSSACNEQNKSNVPAISKGIVKFYNSSKGFGFIKADSSGQDIFVHATGLVDQIRDNDSVSFETVEGKKGLNAVNVRLIHKQ
jgi:CspA family cold shock protein